MAELEPYTVGPRTSIRVAMQKIELNKHRAVVVVDDDLTVLGIVSDGDIRRAFLHDVLAIAPVSDIMQLNPQTTTETDPARRVEILRSRRVTLLPVLSEDNKLIDVELAFEPFVD